MYIRPPDLERPNIYISPQVEQMLVIRPSNG
jgi:hypothetical protein